MKIGHIKTTTFILLFILLSVFGIAKSPVFNKENISDLMKNQKIEFVENKGQMADMEGNAVPFVFYKLSVPGLDVFITEKGLTYSFLKYEKEKNPNKEDKEAIKWTKVEMHLNGASIKKENILTEGSSEFVRHYYLSHCNKGIRDVHSFNKIIIKNVYPSIDWVLYGSMKNGFKYDFIVNPGGNPDLIKLSFNSKKQVRINKKGEIIIKTNYGYIVEAAPIVYQNNGNIIQSSFQFKDKNSIGFKLGNYDLSKVIIIDPSLIWCTSFGGDSYDGPMSIVVDQNDNIFVTGYTASPNYPLTSNGSFQGIINNGADIFLSKFNNDGEFLWSTYYGGNDADVAYSVTCDNLNNVFLTGTTSSTDFPIFNNGTYFQGTFAGGGTGNDLYNLGDSFVLKFDNNGVREWGTYLGGYNIDVGQSIIADNNNNIFVTGYTMSYDFPFYSSGTSYLDSIFSGSGNSAFEAGGDIFISRFDNVGNLLWSTFYGGNGTESAHDINVDFQNNIYLTGFTTSNNFPCQNNGTYFQPNNSGLNDAFILKFDNNGIRKWSTYFGGILAESGFAITLDINNNIFLTGYTNSNNFPLINAGSYFDSTVNSQDAFISKFDSLGQLLWSTYYGGSNNEVLLSPNSFSYRNMIMDECGNLYLAFQTNSSDIPTFSNDSNNFHCGSYHGGMSDILIAKFSNNGNQIWSTYWGGSEWDFRCPIVINIYNDLFITGEISQYTNISIPNYLDYKNTSYMDSLSSGQDDGIIAKFVQHSITSSINTLNTSACSNCDGEASVSILNTQPPFNYIFSNGSQIFNDTNNTIILQNLCSENFWVVIKDYQCNADTIQFVISDPMLQLNTIINDANCYGDSSGNAFAEITNGSPPYSFNWNTNPIQNTQEITGIPAGQYIVDVIDSSGCIGKDTITISQPDSLNIALSGNDNSCYGQNNGMASAAVTGGTSPYTFEWNTNPIQQTNTAIGLSLGNYNVTVTDLNGCEKTSFNIQINQPDSLTITLNVTDISCYHGIDGRIEAIIDGGTPPYNYTWTPGNMNTSAISNLSAGNYFLLVTDANGCGLSISERLIQPAILIDSIINTDGYCLVEGEVSLQIDENYTNYQWYDNLGQVISGANSAGIFVSNPVQGENYSVTFEYDNIGCVRKLIIPLNMLINQFEEPLIANVFTPNNDNTNDVFIIDRKNLSAFQMEIYNRWGQKIFESTDPAKGWDGTINHGQLAPEGIYFCILNYQLKCGDSRQKTKNGFVHLRR